MPLYEYQCDACGERFERIQKFSDPPVEKCPTCGGKVRKLLSSPAIQFKGSGWYITDYAKKGGGVDSGKSGSSAKSDKTDKAEEKGESKTTSTDKPAEKSSSDTTKTS